MSQEIVASHNLRATHDILLAMSGSKRALELILENQNDIFALFTDGGQILKGNAALANFIKQPSDVLFRYNLKSLFSSHSWQMFGNKVEIIKKHRERKNVSFELAVDSEQCRGEELQDFVWTVTRFDSITNRRGQVYSVIGRDMTEIRRFQKRLSMIFGSVPLAIFQIDRQKCFKGPYSAYAEIIFGSENLEGRPFTDTIAKAKSNMTPSQRYGIEQLLESIGEEEFWYDIYKAQFPKEMNFGTKENSLWIGFNYSPIVRDTRVEEILVVAEDITERVMARSKKDTREISEIQYAVIFADAQATDEKTIGRTIVDVEHQITLLKDIDHDNLTNPQQYLNPINSIKNALGQAGLHYVTDLVQRIEDEMLALEGNGLVLAVLYYALETSRRDIVDAWTKVKSILYMVHPTLVDQEEITVNDLRDKLAKLQLLLESKDVSQGITLVTQLLGLINPGIKLRNVQEIEQNLRSSFAKTAVRLDKQVNLEMLIADIPISKEKLNKISEILALLLGNTLTNYLESPSDRLVKQKKQRAKVTITIRKADDQIAVAIEDDGRGLDPAELVASALKRGTITETQAQTMSQHEKLRLIFQPGHPSQEGVQEMSGRGTGMSSADAAARYLSSDGSGIAVESNLGRGTLFSFTCKLD